MMEGTPWGVQGKITPGMARPALLAGLVGFLLFLAGGKAEKAMAHTCHPYGSGVECRWQQNLAPETRNWLQTPNGINRRNWYWAMVMDDHGGNVAKKCVAGQRDDGDIKHFACGSGSPGAYIGDAWQPSRLFTRHNADGYRIIIGRANHN